MIVVRLLLFILIFAFLGMGCSSQNIIENKKSAQSIEELQTQLEHVLNEMHVPGMAVAIVHRDGPEWVAGLGKADLVNNRMASATTST